MQALLLAMAMLGVAVGDGDRPRVLVLTHSAGFQHEVVTPGDRGLNLVEHALLEASRNDFDLTCTQDARAIEAETLKDFDAVLFYTTGELPVPEGGREALIDYVRNGGGFVGVHSATDTFYEFAPYQQMLGGVFDGHPWNEEVTVLVEDPFHPATQHLGKTFEITDEIYQFKDFSRDGLNVVLSLVPASVDISAGNREDGDYALAWWRNYGQGRVFYSALGHGPEVWGDERFLRHLIGALRWAVAEDDLEARRPPGAIALFGAEAGTEPRWTHRDGSDLAWSLDDGAMQVVAGTGDLVSDMRFGDALVHVEFMTPEPLNEEEGQGRGNSGVYVHGRYEIQVLDSFGVEPKINDCGAIYNQAIPAVNACRPPERWQTYDIRFKAPDFDDAGAKITNARMTVWQNGLLIHDDFELPGPTAGGLDDVEAPLGPLMLQDHGNRVRYRNIWMRPLDLDEDEDADA